MSTTIEHLLRDIAARIPSPAEDLEQHEKFLRALSRADAVLQQRFIQWPLAQDGGARDAAYYDVQQVIAHPRYPHRQFEPAGHFGADDAYEAEIVRLWTLFERALATHP